jgi:F-type H+-transporting ATPase subunit beta
MSVKSIGKISQIIGAVIDVSFEQESQIPNIYDALEVTKDDGDVVVLECQQDIGENTIRTIAMDSTDGMRRGMEVRAMGEPISMPIGDNINGRLFNVIGKAIDGIGDVPKVNTYAIHRDPPKFENLSTSKEILIPVLKLST